MGVSVDDLRVAAAWLGDNEGEDGEAEACQRVAEWISAEIERRELNAAVRQIKAQVPNATNAQIKSRLAKRSTAGREALAST